MTEVKVKHHIPQERQTVLLRKSQTTHNRAIRSTLYRLLFVCSYIITHNLSYVKHYCKLYDVQLKISNLYIEKSGNCRSLILLFFVCFRLSASLGRNFFCIFRFSSGFGCFFLWFNVIGRRGFRFNCLGYGCFTHFF